MKACHLMSKRALLLGTSLALVTALECAATQASAQTAPPRDPQLTPGAPLATQAAQPAPEATGDDIIVTGVLRESTADKAAISTTTVSDERIQEVVPIGLADLLSEIPGVVVDTDVGETNANVYARGLSSGTSASTTGYYWTTLLEDGLPVTPLFFQNYQPDQYLRPDVTIKRVQAVRGGSAAITGPNAPGGLFNYISRNGLTDPGIRYSIRLGLEGESNLYQKYEGYYGWRNKGRNLAFSIGGDYRRSFGYRTTPKPINDGGQIKANANWSYRSGFGNGGFLLAVKHLDDVAGSLDNFRPPARGFDNPQFLPEFGRNVNFQPANDIGHFSIYDGQPGYYWDGSAGPRYKSDAIQLKWDHNFGGGWRVSNNIKYNDNRGRQTGSGSATYRSLVGGTTSNDTYNLLGLGLAGLNATPGYYNISDSVTGMLQARVLRFTSAVQRMNGCIASQAGGTAPTGYCLDKNTPNTLPNQQIVNEAPGDSSNLVLSFNNTIGNTRQRSKDIVDQFIVTKTFGRNITLTAGVYFSDINWSQSAAFQGVSLAGLQNNPNTLGVSFAPITGVGTGTAQLALTGPTYQVTNPQGFGGLGSSAGLTSNDTAEVSEVSPLFGATWEITPRLLLDGGARYTWYNGRGTNRRFQTNSRATDRTFGGLDGDPLTLFDNVYAVSPGNVITFDKSIKYLQYTGAINWNINRANTVYFRYTSGKKNQDGFWNGFNATQDLADQIPLSPIPTLTQYEASWSFRNKWLTNQLVMYYTDVVGIANRKSDTTRLPDGVTAYTTRPFYNHLDVLGVELDNRIRITKWLNIRNVFSWTRSRALAQAAISVGACNGTNYLTVAACNNRPECFPLTTPASCTFTVADAKDVTLDDFGTYQSGPQERSPSIVYNGTVNLKFGPVSGYYRFRYIDDRPTAITATRFLPPQKNSDMGVRWQVNKWLNAAFNINNLFNDINLTQIGDFAARPSALTDEQYQDLYPNALITVRTNAPRSYFLTFSGSF